MIMVDLDHFPWMKGRRRGGGGAGDGDGLGGRCARSWSPFARNCGDGCCSIFLMMGGCWMEGLSLGRRQVRRDERAQSNGATPQQRDRGTSCTRWVLVDGEVSIWVG